MAKSSLDDRLNQIEDKISEKSFRENKELGNEVGYYIFDYDPREELYVRNHIAYLKDRINNGNKDFRIVEFKALIYMHRYDADTVGRVRTDYLHKAQKYVETAMQSAQYTIDNATSASEKWKATKAVTNILNNLQR